MATKTRKVTKPIEESVEASERIETPSEALSKKKNTIKLKRSQFYSYLSVLTFFAGILVGYFIWGGGTSTEAQYVRHKIPTDGFYAIGPENAPITIVEFSDYQCPYCRQWEQEVYNDLLAAYPDKIRLVYRNFPLTTIHPDAMSAAEAAMCAGEQNVYWQYHDKLFSNETLGTDTYLQYAQELNLNMDIFEACITSSKFKDFIQADSDFAMKEGVRATPTFFINGIMVVGAQPLGVFQQIIDKELAGEIPQ